MNPPHVPHALNGAAAAPSAPLDTKPSRAKFVMPTSAAASPATRPKDRATSDQTDRPWPRVLIEEWLPAAAIGVEAMRERGTGNNPPNARLHVWWARRPLCASRAAVLASLLPADFDRSTFERLLGFGDPQIGIHDIDPGRRIAPAHRRRLDHVLQNGSRSEKLVAIRWCLDSGLKFPGAYGGADRAFKAPLAPGDLKFMQRTIDEVWGNEVRVIDPMAGGGSIPLESARLGIETFANEYNPVACSVLEATVDYPFRFGTALADKARRWGKELRSRFARRVEHLFPATGVIPPLCYIFARTVPCPDTGHETPLVPDWHLLKPKSGRRVVAVPEVDAQRGTWIVQMREVGREAGQIRNPPAPTYHKGKGISLFTGRPVAADYIKAMACQGRMKSALYAVVLKTPQGLTFVPPGNADLAALDAAEKELARLRPAWERENIIPTEEYPEVTTDPRPRRYGMPRWADMFTPRQLLCMGVLVEELRRLRDEIVRAEGEEVGEAVLHLLAFAVDKLANYNNTLASWHAPRQVIRSLFDRHDFSFKITFTEMAPCNAGAGLDWSIENVAEPFEKIAELPRHDRTEMVNISQGSATNLADLSDGSITAVVVDPPYADNVQYCELADFFYVWLKRTQGHRRPEWFSTYLCDHDEEAVVNLSRHRNGKTAVVRQRAREFYRRKMSETFAECRRILRDDGVLTVMFTHKKQDQWEALFESLIEAGFTITATWPVKTESEHSLHQAKKNAAQSTVILVARKRPPDAGVGYYGEPMRAEIAARARSSAMRLAGGRLDAVDQLVGSFGPAMEVFSRYGEVRTDTGHRVEVGRAIDEAAEAVSRWRIEQIAARGLEGVEAEGQFALLCWDVLGAAEFRFNEAKLLGNAVGMDVDQLVVAGLVSKSGDKVQMLSAIQRRREKAIEADKVEEILFGTVIVPGRKRKKDVLKVHPNDPRFRTALDACHVLALRYIEGGWESGGVGAARSLAHRQNWGPESPVARLMEALVRVAPEAMRYESKRKDAASNQYPEFRAWHALLTPLFGLEAPDWTQPEVERDLFGRAIGGGLEEDAEEGDDGEDTEDDDSAEEDAQE